MGFTGGRWTADKYFKREEATEQVEFVVELLHSFVTDASRAVPVLLVAIEFWGWFHLKVKAEQLRPVFIDNISQLGLLNGTRAKATGYSAHNLSLR